jgi:hypothetical protein
MNRSNLIYSSTIAYEMMNATVTTFDFVSSIIWQPQNMHVAIDLQIYLSKSQQMLRALRKY